MRTASRPPRTRHDSSLAHLPALGLLGALVVAPALAARGRGAVPRRTLALLGFAAGFAGGRRRSRAPAGEEVERLLSLLERRDRYTASHCARVAAFADLLAEELGGLSSGRLRNLRVAALLHDVGKLEVPLEILHKPARLSEAEWVVMRAHVRAGARLAAPLEDEICRIIAQHHERPDGRGYPLGLEAGEICLEARIVAVADAFDAMTSDRPYRAALSADTALRELARCASDAATGRQFDARVVAALARRFDEVRVLCTPRAARRASPSA